jgi:multicomponent Na+:H+ antiporter subunit F
MSTLLSALTVVLIVTLFVGVWRVQRGPTAADRMLSALLIGSTAVATLLLLAQLQQEPALRVAALLVVMLAAIVSIAYAAIAQTPGAPTPEPVRVRRAEDEP